MAFFNRLPDELILQILESVSSEHNSRQRAFRSLALVCRRLNRVVTPLLYESFQGCCLHHTELFGRTIFSSPKVFSTYVKQLSDHREDFHTCNTKPFPRKRYERSYTRKATTRANLLQIPPEARLQMIRRYSTSLETTYIACRCPNIEFLDLVDEEMTILVPLNYAIYKEPLGTVHEFTKLHTMRITVHHSFDYYLNDISYVFSLPSLRTLSVDGAGMKFMTQADRPWHCKPNTSPIQNLIFGRCLLDGPWFARAISSCCALKSFVHRFDYGIHSSLGAPVGPQSLPNIYDTLGMHYRTLEEVVIEEIDGERVTLTVWQHLRLFGTYNGLKRMHIPLYTLINGGQYLDFSIPEILPPTLEEIRFDVKAQREGPRDQFFISLASSIPTYLRNLHKIHVYCRIENDTHQGRLPLHFCHLERMFKSVGVEFTFRVEYIFCKSPTDIFHEIMKTIWNSGADGREIVRNCFIGDGCWGCTPFHAGSNFKVGEMYVDSWFGDPAFN